VLPTPRLLLVADDAIARAGLTALAERAGIQVAADVAPEDVTASHLESADAIAWDAGPSGSFEALRVSAPRLPVLALPWTADQARDALAAGARGVLSRDRLEQELLASLQAVSLGLIVLDEAFAEGLLRPAAPADALVEPLTARESEVLQLLAEGLTNRARGERLGISEHTAKFHVNAILGKLAARSRGEAIAQAARLGLLVL
jgi:DNA-binding NarL/FixJ family response regulator